MTQIHACIYIQISAHPLTKRIHSCFQIALVAVCTPYIRIETCTYTLIHAHKSMYDCGMATVCQAQKNTEKYYIYLLYINVSSTYLHTHMFIHTYVCMKKNTCRQTMAMLSWQIIDKCYDTWQRFVVYVHINIHTYVRTQIATGARLSYFFFPRMRSA